MVLHVALQAAVFGEYTWEVFVYCWELHFHLLLLLLPYLLLAANLGCFLLCSRANPGEIPALLLQTEQEMPQIPWFFLFPVSLAGTVTKSNAASLAKVYAYDGVLFQRGLVCPTCTLEKPARSKHCSKDLRFLNNRGSKSFPKEFSPSSHCSCSVTSSVLTGLGLLSWGPSCICPSLQLVGCCFFTSSEG